MKTIKEVAKIVNVSKTSIYNLIKKHNIPTLKREGKTFLDENGENLVLGYYSSEQYETISDIIQDTKEETNQASFQDSKPLEYIKVIEILEDERAEKNKIIRELIQTNKILSQSLVTDKINETARLMIKDKMCVVNDNVKESKGFLNRIFKRKNLSNRIY